MKHFGYGIDAEEARGFVAEPEATLRLRRF